MIELLLEAERALEMGRVDAAETMYRQVAEGDPRNAIAVVGLARVALERGDEAGALDIARRALVIDPENAAAGRMVARLEEVITYRGEAVPAAVPAVSPEPQAVVERTSPEPDASAVAEPVAQPEPQPVAEPVAEPNREPVVETVAEPQPVPVAEPVAEPEPSAGGVPPKRRSWLDRLLRRNR